MCIVDVVATLSLSLALLVVFAIDGNEGTRTGVYFYFFVSLFSSCRAAQTFKASRAATSPPLCVPHSFAAFRGSINTTRHSTC